MKLINNTNAIPLFIGRHMTGSKALFVLCKAAVMTCQGLVSDVQRTSVFGLKLAGKSSIFHVEIGAKVDPVMSW